VVVLAIDPGAKGAAALVTARHDSRQGVEVLGVMRWTKWHHAMGTTPGQRILEEQVVEFLERLRRQNAQRRLDLEELLTGWELDGYAWERLFARTRGAQRVNRISVEVVRNQSRIQGWFEGTLGARVGLEAPRMIETSPVDSLEARAVHANSVYRHEELRGLAEGPAGEHVRDAEAIGEQAVGWWRREQRRTQMNADIRG